jgi:hypothetical protein
MGQTAGDCKVAIKDQQPGSAEQQPGAFHTQLNNFDHVHLLQQAGAKPTECPSLPPLTINDQQTNANAIRPTDVVVSPGGNAIQSTYEAQISVPKITIQFQEVRGPLPIVRIQF